MRRKIERPFAAGADNIDVNNGTDERLTQETGRDPRLPYGTNFCLCAACGRYFGGVNGFERHRVNFQCVDAATIGLRLNRGRWVRTPPKAPVLAGAPKIKADISTDPARGYRVAAARLLGLNPPEEVSP